MGKLVGVPDDVMADARVQEALGVVERGIDKEAAIAVTTGPVNPFEKYGLTMRKSGIQHQAIISRVMWACPKMPAVIQAMVWLWSLAAPLTEVYGAVQSLEDGKLGGFDEFNGKVDAWFERRGLQGKILQEIIVTMGEQMELTQKLSMPATDDKEGTVKNG